LLKIYIYGYLNRIHSSRRLEREAECNVELMWLTGHLAPDFQSIADFRKDNGKSIRSVAVSSGNSSTILTRLKSSSQRACACIIIVPTGSP
jgi:hypothetical protein